MQEVIILHSLIKKMMEQESVLSGVVHSGPMKLIMQSSK